MANELGDFVATFLLDKMGGMGSMAGSNIVVKGGGYCTYLDTDEPLSALMCSQTLSSKSRLAVDRGTKDIDTEKGILWSIMKRTIQ